MRNGMDRGAVVIGLLYLVAGVAFLLEAVGVFAIAPGVLWPLVIIGFGIGIAFGARPSEP